MYRTFTSYAAQIKGYTRIFDATVHIYRRALNYLIRVANEHYDEWIDLDSMRQSQLIERLVHSTKTNKAIYDFDAQFYKYPSYLRRATIKTALGIVSSYRSNYNRWLTNGQQGKAPVLRVNHYKCPTFFRKGMFEQIDDYTVCLKIYYQNDWVWLTIPLRKSDMDYIRRHKSQWDQSAPTLEKRKKGYALRFGFLEEIGNLASETNVILGVDLGVNTQATIVAMRPDGTVLGRKFISFTSNIDRMTRTMNQIKRNQQRGNIGFGSNKRLWTHLKGINKQIAVQTAHAIVDMAKEYGAGVIVFEYLDLHGKKKGGRSMRQRLHFWNYREVFAVAGHQAHLNGIRISRVNAWNTSRLAFDGSGRVKRGREIKQPYSVVEFSSGKRYNADLNAAYNIAARYYIRAYLKSLPETVESEVLAKAPKLAARSTCTLSDLISLFTVIQPVSQVNLLG